MGSVDLNLDFSRPVVIDTTSEPWTSSPLPGVDRKRLEREREEAGLTTSIVRYAPGSSFSRHAHPGGEEFLVLDGVFSDETGDYPAGSYVRNPPGSAHTPYSEPGCTIFVKLCQMGPEDRERVVVDTATATAWQPGLRQGHQTLTLYRNRHEWVLLERLAADASINRHPEPGGLEMLVVAGELLVDGRAHGVGTWLRFPVDSVVSTASNRGCTFYSKRGHLARR